MLYQTYDLNFLNLDYDKIVSECFRIEEKCADREHISNRNGGIQVHHPHWRKYLSNLYIEKDLLVQLTKFVSDLEKRKTNPYYWMNINYPGSYNSAHTHAGGKKAAVFYVKVPEDSGNLIFTETDEEVIPKQGLLVVFDINTWHAVSPNFSDEPRISFAFNY